MSVIVTFPYSLGLPGGGPIDCVEITMSLASSGADVTLVYVRSSQDGVFPRRLDLDAGAEDHILDALDRAGVTVVAVVPNKFHYWLDARRVCRTVEDLLRPDRENLVVSFWHEGRYLRSLLKNFRLRQFVIAAASYGVWIDDDRDQREKYRFKSLPQFVKYSLKRAIKWPLHDFVKVPLNRLRAHYLVGRYYRAADHILARSEFCADEVERYFEVARDRISVVHCGINQKFRTVMRRRDRMLRFLYFGAINQEKGAFDMLKAFSSPILSTRDDWSLTIVGWGDLEKAKDIVESNLVVDKVRFVGKLDQDGLIREMESADISVLPSYGESFGLAAAESIAAGLPIVAYNVAALPEVVSDGETGWLVPVGSVDSLTEQIEEILEAPESIRYMSKNCRTATTGKYYWHNTAEAILSLANA